MNKTSICDSKLINLESTLDGGQAFRWHRNGDHYRGVIGNKVYIISNENNLIYLNSLNFRMDEKDLKKIKKYLGLDFNLEEFKNIYRNDDYIYKLINQNCGLRILKQDPWETIVSFITSSVSNILKIKKNINDLCIFNGKKIGDGKFDYVFPTYRELLEIGEKNLRMLGFGFRSPYLIDAANKCIKLLELLV